MTVSVFDVDPFAVSPHMPVYDDTQPYTWACSCGAKSRRSWEDSYDRTVAWIHHAERSEGRARTVPGVPGSPTAPLPEASANNADAPCGGAEALPCGHQFAAMVYGDDSSWCGACADEALRNDAGGRLL